MDRMSFVKLIDRMDSGEISWEEFAGKVKKMHEKRVGAPYQREAGPTLRLEENFYANPYPGCICDRSDEAGHLMFERNSTFFQFW
ncbi:hypothetical protein SASPL_100621 [Salvia splendens]|uniref:Uncharacterized protein n=1 Tax=Salvia splendens TaxID=180675 RepID=A0A8X9ACM7_SALSN|nr:hypothetical protein SASPL_100621 [Salvia splendens]